MIELQNEYLTELCPQCNLPQLYLIRVTSKKLPPLTKQQYVKCASCKREFTKQIKIKGVKIGK